MGMKEDLAKEYPDEPSARRMLGSKVITLREFSGIPIGTRGTIVDTYHVGKAGYGVDIQWHRDQDNTAMEQRHQAFRKPLVDGFSWGEVEHFLELETVLEPGDEVCPRCWGDGRTPGHPKWSCDTCQGSGAIEIPDVPVQHGPEFRS